MDEACAEGIGNEHYRLEGRSLPIFFLFVVKLVGVLFQLNGKKNPIPKTLFGIELQVIVWLFDPVLHPFLLCSTPIL